MIIQMPDKTHASSIAEIDLRALGNNLRQVRAQIGERDILAVIKANAYGHGAVRVARYLVESKIKTVLLGVAFLEEAIVLREGGITGPIVLMTGAPLDQIDTIVYHRFTPVVYDAASLHALSRSASAAGQRLSIHVKIDTGMGRLGLPSSEALPFIREAVSQSGIRVEGILTHFAHPDLNDKSFTQQQLESIQSLRSELKEEGIEIPYCHLANSSAVMHYEPAYLNLVRPGLMLYGYSPIEKDASFPLKPVMQVKARVLSIKKVASGTSISYGRTYFTQRESRIATVAFGYADGYPVRLSNRGTMIAKGRIVPVVGRVCMDMTMLDVTNVPSLNVGDWVTVIGAEGDSMVWASRLARWAGTHPYEILCGIGPRVQRRYLP